MGPRPDRLSRPAPQHGSLVRNKTCARRKHLFSQPNTAHCCDRLGIAIGDVSGKGMSAALLMASLHASLRGQVLSGAGDLGATRWPMSTAFSTVIAARSLASMLCEISALDPVSLGLAPRNANRNCFDGMCAARADARRGLIRCRRYERSNAVALSR